MPWKHPACWKRLAFVPECSCQTIQPLVFHFFWGANNFRGENDFSIAFFSSFYILASKQVLRCGGWVTQWYTTDYYRAELLGSFRIRCGWWRWTSWVFCGLWQVIVQKWPIRMRCWLSIVDLFMSSLESIAEDDSGGHISQQSIKHTIKQQKDLRHIGPKHRNLQAPFVIFFTRRSCLRSRTFQRRPAKKKKTMTFMSSQLDSYTR